MTFSRALVISILAIALARPSVARADAAPAGAPCGKEGPGLYDASKLGTTCLLAGRKGTCQKQTCTGPDYKDFDGGTGTPPIISYDCLRCLPPQGPSDAAPPDDASIPSGSGTSASSSSTSGSPSSDSGGCSSSGTLGATAPWLLALLVPLVTFASKRRRTSR